MVKIVPKIELVELQGDGKGGEVGGLFGLGAEEGDYVVWSGRGE